MLKKTKYFKGIYGQNQIEFVEGLIHVTTFGINSFDTNDVMSHAHNNLYQIFILEHGTTELIHKEKPYEVSAPAFITIPKNVAHGFSHKSKIRGWVISLSDSTMEYLFQKEPDILFELDDIHINSLNSDEVALIEVYQTMKKCITEYQHNLTGRNSMLKSYVIQLIVQLYRLPSDNMSMIPNTSSKGIDSASKIYFRRFMQLIKSAKSFKKPIEEYATELNISYSYLNRICHTMAGKSPKEIFMDYLLLEAQVQLSQVDKSIAQVAYEISFDDPAYFSRIFKKRVGITPKEFREKHGIIKH